jgi:GNAT superfamily N-acetyltransferase
MDLAIRPAHTGDHRRIAAIAAEGGADGVDGHYLSFVAAHGRLLVATDSGRGDDTAVAFGGMLPIRGVAMVTDLFVSAAGRGCGAGGAVLSALLDGYERRMTCSSQHPAALPVYRRAGMVPRWRLLYLRGNAAGGGPVLCEEPWAGDRPELVRHYAERGAIVTADAVVEVHDGEAFVPRMQAVDAVAAMDRILAALPAGMPVRACVPEPRPLARVLRERGFVVADHDVFCATAGVEFASRVSCVHPGLA